MSGALRNVISSRWWPSLRMLGNLGNHFAAEFHQTFSLRAQINKNVQPMSFSSTKKKKSKVEKQQSQVIKIRQNMTLSEISVASGRSLDDIFEALLSVPEPPLYEEKNDIVEKIEVTKAILKKLGLRHEMETTRVNKAKEDKDAYPRAAADPAVLVRRPAVVTIMGHVDHGKTTLLDSLRHSRLVDGEFGGITQHMSAFSVRLESGERITFLDTPGHAAFHAMRHRGAHATDIVVLVIAADDGVMKQTVESIMHAREAGVPIIVAVNKMDKPEADAERCVRALLEHDVVVEELGGEVQAVPISAFKGTNLSQLQEAIVAQAEVMGITCDPTGYAEGLVLEAQTDSARGKLATVLVQRGCLKRGAVLVSGQAWGKVRGMFDDRGAPVNEALPGQAVQVIGWRELPGAGQAVLQVDSEKRAHEVINWRKQMLMADRAEKDRAVIDAKAAQHAAEYQEQLRLRRQLGRRRLRPGELVRPQPVEQQTPQLSVLIKGDVAGSVEALLDVLDSYNSQLCRLDIIHYGVGPITESDVQLAADFNGVVLAFNVPTCSSAVQRRATELKVELIRFNVIYRLLEALVERLEQRLPLASAERVIGEALVMKPFTITEGKKKISVAGCRCTSGVLQKKHSFRLLRDGEVVHEGRSVSMKHLKNEVDSVKTDVECGLHLDDSSLTFCNGDRIVCYETVQVAQKIDWSPDF